MVLFTRLSYKRGQLNQLKAGGKSFQQQKTLLYEFILITIKRKNIRDYFSAGIGLLPSLLIGKTVILTSESFSICVGIFSVLIIFSDGYLIRTMESRNLLTMC